MAWVGISLRPPLPQLSVWVEQDLLEVLGLKQWQEKSFVKLSALLSRETWWSSMCFPPCLGAPTISTMFSVHHITDMVGGRWWSRKILDPDCLTSNPGSFPYLLCQQIMQLLWTLVSSSAKWGVQRRSIGQSWGLSKETLDMWYHRWHLPNVNGYHGPP